MRTKGLLLFAILLSTTMFAQQGTKNEPVSGKKVNNTLGVCMMGKTMQCNGVTISYIASEQGKMTPAYGACWVLRRSAS